MGVEGSRDVVEGCLIVNLYFFRGEDPIGTSSFLYKGRIFVPSHIILLFGGVWTYIKKCVLSDFL